MIGLTSIENVLGVLQFVFAGGESELLLQLKKRRLRKKTIRRDFFIQAIYCYNGLMTNKVVSNEKAIVKTIKKG